MSDDKRLIEDLIPVKPINAASYIEKKGGGRGLPSKMHLWWARRPLAAARAATYATLLRASDTDDAHRSPEYFSALCRWGADEHLISDARSRVLQANGGIPPKVLDLFSGGGAIPLEAARLGCEATAIELNPVAHLIELCTLHYPQRFGPSLADDVREWSHTWLDKAWTRVSHLYPPIDDGPSAGDQLNLAGSHHTTHGRRPIAYLWTRTVRCPHPSLGEHHIPLVRQTWLSKRKGRHAALRPTVDTDALQVRWDVVEARSKEALGFDPSAFSSRGRADCPVCGTSVDTAYVKAEGAAGRIATAPLAAVLPAASGRGREYHGAGRYALPTEKECGAVLNTLDVMPPNEPIPSDDSRNFWTPSYGLVNFRDLFTPRQLATLCALASSVREVHKDILATGVAPGRAEAICSYLGLALDRVADWGSTLVRWYPQMEVIKNTFSRQALPMVWDFAESAPFASASGSVEGAIGLIADSIEACATVPDGASVIRASATQVPLEDGTQDAVITDPPYYDNISYADLSDFFYVWLKRSIGFLYPEHLAGELTPKHHEAIVAPYRHAGDKEAARAFYESEMRAAFQEAHRVLKQHAPLVCVYAHKTTLGWASLVEALRAAGFVITEAWPLDTEMKDRSIAQGTASLASSIFLVARRRETDSVGNHSEVVGELDEIIGERLKRLSDAGVAGSDLVIAAIGAGLGAFTRHSSVELPNGEEVPASDFLEEVQTRVLNAVLAKLHGFSDGVDAIDAATRYYVISRFTLGYGEIEFDEANNLAKSAGVELSDLAATPRPLAKITKDKVKLLDYKERGEDPELGIVGTNGSKPTVIDTLHGLLWRANHRREDVPSYLDEAQVDSDKLRNVAQALQGRALRAEGEDKPPEAQACERLLGAWRALVDDNLMRS